jgi:anti-sigma factor RsiW
MKCDGYRILIREMLHGRLDVDEATVVAAHMDACESCRSFHRELAAGDPAGGEHIAEVASAPEKPPAARAGILPVAIAVSLAVLFLGGLVFVAKHVGWRLPNPSSWNAGHHSPAHGRSR